MGTRVSKQEVTKEHFLFKKVSVKSEYGKELIVTTKPFMDDEYAEWKMKYDEMRLISNKQFMLLPEEERREEIKKEFMCCECPADIELSLTFQSFDFFFQQELGKRMAQKKHYSEEELFYLFYSLLEAAKEFQLKCIPVGDIRPGNMVITKKQQLKMITVASIPSESTNISKFLDRYDLKTIFYFSPEELDYINSKGYSAVTYPNAKTEAYSIGLTIMDAALFESCEDLYNWSSLRKEIKKDLIDLRLKKIAFKYPVFETYLSKVLAFQMQQRLSTGEAWATLRPYSQAITEKTHFCPQPTKQANSLKEFRSKFKL